MADTITAERITARREQLQAEHTPREYGFGTECRCGEVVPCPVLADELAWLAEVERLRAALKLLKEHGGPDLTGTPELLDEQEKEIEVRVRQAFEDADHIDLNSLTATELTDLVMAGIQRREVRS